MRRIMSDHARRISSRFWKRSSRINHDGRPSVGFMGDHARIDPISIKSVVSIMIAPVLILSAVIGYSVQTASGASNNDSRINTIDGAVVSSRSFRSASSADRDANASKVSRSAFRESISTDVDGDWGGIGSMNMPYSRSTDQNSAVNALNSSVKNGKSLYASTADVSTDEHRSALKTLLDQAPDLTNNEQASVEDLDGLRKKIDAAADAVEEDVEETRAPQYTASSAPVMSASAPNAGVIKPSNGKTGEDVVDYAMQFIGRPYVWGGSTPQGWDCSGYVMYVYSQFGVSLPHYSGAQAQAGNSVASIADARPGDIVVNDSHAAIYIGNGTVVNALNPEAGTIVTPVEWAFSGGYQIRRIIG
jgi:cell wall-associated NlpC family hydrolase